MKEISIKLANIVADRLQEEAEDKGITLDELIRHTLGTYAQSVAAPMPPPGYFDSALSQFSATLSKVSREGLKFQATHGILSCKNCTLKLSVQDVENGKCGSCGEPIQGSGTREEL